MKPTNKQMKRRFVTEIIGLIIFIVGVFLSAYLFKVYDSIIGVLFGLIVALPGVLLVEIVEDSNRRDNVNWRDM